MKFVVVLLFMTCLLFKNTLVLLAQGISLDLDCPGPGCPGFPQYSLFEPNFIGPPASFARRDTAAIASLRTRADDNRRTLSSGQVASRPPQSIFLEFRWPARGRIIASFGAAGNEGINIALPEGTPVRAAESGTIAYSDDGLPGYGKLLLVRHRQGYVSVYAHNSALLVRRGEEVRRGQVIAMSGMTGSAAIPQLAFQIRLGAQPVDPLPLLTGGAAPDQPDDRIGDLISRELLETAIAPDLRSGDPQVTFAQRALLELGFDVGEVDGLLGPRTRSKIEQFQSIQGLVVDGLPNSETIEALRRAVEGS